MFFKKNVIKVFISIALLAFTNADEYDYHEQPRWYDQYKECGMKKQSPIEINIKDAIIQSEMPAISFKFYETSYTEAAKCENNGHTINIQLPKPPRIARSKFQNIYDQLQPHITGGPFQTNVSYIADSVHFHWGSRDTHGSEHVINSQRYAMEMHIVHRNSNYTSMEEARTHADGLAVIAILFKVQSTLKTDFLGLNSILTALEHVAKYNETSEITNFKLSTLFNNLDTTEFFTYAGSLTTPPCSQAVTWLIFSKVIEISHEQMSRFRYISDASDHVLENNYRSLQPKGERKVYFRQLLDKKTTENSSRLYNDDDNVAIVADSDKLVKKNLIHKILSSIVSIVKHK